MAFDELKENIAEAEKHARSYFEYSAEYYKLKGFKFMMKGIISTSKSFMVLGIVSMAVLFFSLAAAFGIAELMDSSFYGFLFVGLFYVLIGIILYLLRHKIDKPLLEKFSEFYFDES